MGGRPLMTFIVPVGDLVERGQDVLRGLEHQEAGEDRDHDRGQHRAVDADPRRLDGGDLVLARHHAEGDEHGHQHRHRRQQVQDLRARERVVVEDDRALHPVVLDVVEEVHEAHEHEQRPEGGEHQRRSCRSSCGRCSGRGCPGPGTRPAETRTTTTRRPPGRGRAAAASAARRRVADPREQHLVVRWGRGGRRRPRGGSARAGAGPCAPRMMLAAHMARIGDMRPVSPACSPSRMIT